jgi:hypothetical protein
LDLVGRYRFVFTGADPGSDFVAVTCLSEFVDQTLNATALGEKAAEHAKNSVRAARILVLLILATKD